MILAAAIKYHIKSTDEDVVLCGCRHGDITEQLKALGFQPHEDYEELDEGFITHKNEFLTRSQAYKHAKECGQIGAKLIEEREEPNGFGDKLISEDLW